MIGTLTVPGDTGETDRATGDDAHLDLTGLPAGFVRAAAAGTDPTAEPAPGPADGAADGAVVDLSDAAERGSRRSRRRRAAPPSAALDVLDLARRGGVRVLEAAVPWRAVLPTGGGPVDAPAVARLDRWVDEVLAAGVTPWLVLHADDGALPDPVRAAGGWAARDTAQRFADHATAVHAAVADRVARWTTLHGAAGPTGVPGSLTAAHHRLLGHALALAGMRAQAPADHRFGITLDLCGVRPGRGVSTADAVLVDGLVVRWWLDALLRGGYPQDALAALEQAGEPVGVVAAGDLVLAARPPDRLGVRYPGDLVLGPAGEGAAALPAVPAVGPTGRHVTPDGLVALLVRIGREYPGAPPLVVSGAALDDAEGAVAAAARAGASVAGYVAGPLVAGG
jgi:beta-glucosidase